MQVSLIGFGLAGRVFHAPLIAATPRLELAIIASRQADLIRASYPQAEVVSDAAAAIDRPEIDLVVIASPNNTHVPLAKAALRAGKHVVVDKPFTTTLAEARELTAIAERAGRIISVFQNRRWDSDFLALQQAVRDRRIGDIVELRSEFSRWRPDVRERWREMPGPGSGVWYDLGPHLADQAMVLFGVPERVEADLQIQREGGKTVDYFHVVLGYGRTRVVLTASSLAADPMPRFVVRGTKGSLVKHAHDPQESQLSAGIKPGSAVYGEDRDPLVLFDGESRTEIAVPRGDYPLYYRGVRDALQGVGKPPVTPAQATALMAVIEAAIRSSDEQRVIRPEFTDAERAAFAQAH